MKNVLFVMFVLLLANVYASCENNQIDINSATIKELEQLYGIGPAKAQAIIDARPFDSIDDLINVQGIGEKTLEGIKSQDIACVEKEDRKKDNERLDLANEETEEVIDESLGESAKIETKRPEIIRLNAQTIKSPENTDLKTGNYAFYGLIGFSALLGGLFLLRKRKYKNEFEN